MTLGVEFSGFGLFFFQV